MAVDQPQGHQIGSGGTQMSYLDLEHELHVDEDLEEDVHATWQPSHWSVAPLPVELESELDEELHETPALVRQTEQENLTKVVPCL